MPDKPLITAGQLQKDLAFSDVNLGDAMMNQAGMFAHYAVLSAQALERFEKAKMITEITESKASQRLREEMLAEGGKVVEKKVESELGQQKDVMKARKAQVEAKAMSDLARNALEAFKQRRDMLVQVGVSMREELKGEARVAAKVAERQARREGVEATMTDGSTE